MPDIAARTLTGHVLVRFQPDRSIAGVAALFGDVLTVLANAVQAWNGTQGSSVSANGARPVTPLPAARAAGARRSTVQWADMPAEAHRAVPWQARAAEAVAAALATPQENGRSQAAAQARRPASLPRRSAACAQPVRLDRERPSALRGLQARWAATLALQHCCLGLNAHRGRPRLAYADVVDGESQRRAHHA